MTTLPRMARLRPLKEFSSVSTQVHPRDGGLEKLGDWGGDVRVLLDEALVEAADAEEGADVLGALRHGPVGDGLDFLGMFLNPLRGDNETAEIDARHREEALRPLSEELFGAEFGKDQAEMSLVVDFSARMDDDVVNVNRAELVILLEQEIRGSLECGGRVTEAKGHDAELEGAIAGLEGGAFAVLGDDLDLVEARTKVHLSEHSGTSHGVQTLVYAGNRVHDFLCQLVEAAVVDAEAETAIVLLGEEHACTVRGVG